MFVHRVSIYVSAFACVLATEQCLPDKPFVRFFKVRSCYKSNMPVIAWRNFNGVDGCLKFAREKNGLAFNYGSPEVMNSTNVHHYKNCQILGCPETKNSSTFVYDPSFDYYSAYGNFNNTENATCIKSVGLFSVVSEKKKYSQAINYCQGIGGDLADILTETRTNTLANSLKSLNRWYKAAYIGLDDTDREGVFVTAMGYQLDCTKFRAWSPGHPRTKKNKEDCVILDSDRVWRAINCRTKLGFICEFFPDAPPEQNGISEKNYCKKIKERRKWKECLSNNELYNLYKNATRQEQCALVNLDLEMSWLHLET